MTTFSGDADPQQLCRCSSTEHDPADATSEADLPRLLQHLRRRIDRVRTAPRSGSLSTADPSELALTVVAEALAIGEAMSRVLVEAPSDEPGMPRSSAVYAEIDSRFVERRSRALRSALHGVDDYVWWGGLTQGPAHGPVEGPAAATR